MPPPTSEPRAASGPPPLIHPTHPPAPSRRARLAGVRGLCGLFAAAMCGCVSLRGTNPAIPLTHAQARAVLADMRKAPVPLQRPLVVLAGYRAWHFSIAEAAATLRKATSGRKEDVLAVSYPLYSDIDAIAARVVAAVEERWPSPDPACTREVDVVGVSMGGIVARWAALDPADRRLDGRGPPRACKRLHVRRLFTLATPHQGAALAGVLRPDGAARDLAPGSTLLARLNERLAGAGYDLFCYARCFDHMVGASRAAPSGRVPIWHDRTPILAHITIAHDPLFLADIARRLRGEPPLLEEGPPPRRD